MENEHEKMKTESQIGRQINLIAIYHFDEMQPLCDDVRLLTCPGIHRATALVLQTRHEALERRGLRRAPQRPQGASGHPRGVGGAEGEHLTHIQRKNGWEVVQ
jgi:hypothetical protein